MEFASQNNYSPALAVASVGAVEAVEPARKGLSGLVSGMRQRLFRGEGGSTSGSQQSVRASLMVAFACVLAGALAIAVFSLFQMGRLNASTHIIYEQEYTAGQAAEQVRSYVLRASRAQTQLLTASTASERDALAGDIETSLTNVGTLLDVIRQRSSSDESMEAAKQLVDALAKWTKRLREYMKLVKEQPLSFMEMSPDVAMEDAGLVNETKKVEKFVDALVQQRGQSAQATMLQAAHIYDTSLWVSRWR